MKVTSIVFAVVIAISVLPVFSQSKLPTEQTATTKDGKTVILKGDGTWQYASPAQTGDSLGELTIEAALVYRSGDVKPVARANFTLLDESAVKILRDAGLSTNPRERAMGGDTDSNLLFTFASGLTYPELPDYSGFIRTAMSAMPSHVKATGTSDFQGNVTFKDLAPGIYHAMCYYRTPRGFAFWNMQVDVKPGKNTIVFDQNNAAVAL